MFDYSGLCVMFYLDSALIYICIYSHHLQSQAEQELKSQGKPHLLLDSSG